MIMRESTNKYLLSKINDNGSKPRIHVSSLILNFSRFDISNRKFTTLSSFKESAHSLEKFGKTVRPCTNWKHEQVFSIHKPVRKIRAVAPIQYMYETYSRSTSTTNRKYGKLTLKKSKKLKLTLNKKAKRRNNFERVFLGRVN